MEDDPFQFFKIPFNDMNEDNQSSPIVQANDSEDTPTQSNEDNEVGEREMEHHNIADELKNLPITVLQISKKTAANQELIRDLQHRITQLERATNQLINTIRKSDREQHNQHDSMQERHYKPCRNTVPTTSKTSNSCAFCNGNHGASECPTYPTLTERRQQCGKRNKCERCLKTVNHLATSCTVNIQCFYCRRNGREQLIKRHNSAFRPYQFPM
ncbi:unnamed protein product [Haemonchus placei]|uniref:Uncharacterized protein n=1 Tax=Haemonchus placei TaxID=6290 RepID=A0A0N4WNS8_HAEPC|nr:unnamed protein product [Haemonchus placei]